VITIVDALPDGRALYMKWIYEVLIEHGLSTTIPQRMMLQTAHFREFIWNPIGLPTSMHTFYWNNVKCMIYQERGYGMPYIRVYDLTPGVGEQIIKELGEEIVRRHPKPQSLTTIDVFAGRITMSGSKWIKISDRPKRDISTVFLKDDMMKNLVDEIQQFLKSSSIYDKYGVTWKRVHLFHGPPGTGKTSTVIALAGYFGYNIAKLTMSPELTSIEVENLFNTVPPRSMMLIEDVDCLFTKREAKTKLDFSTLLNCLDGVGTTRGLILFMTTNNKDVLDDACIRPGRVDSAIVFSPPSRLILLNALKELAPSYENEYEAFLDANPNITIAEIQKHAFDCILQKRPSFI